VLRNDPQAMGLLPDGDTESSAAGTAEDEASTTSPWTFSEVFRSSAFWCLFALQFFFLCGFSIANMHIVPMVMSSPLGLAEGAARELGSMVISYYLMVSIFGAVVAGVLADRFPKKWIMFVQFLSLLTATSMLFELSSMLQIYAFALFFGLAFGGCMVVFSLLLVEVFGVDLFSRIMGIPFMLWMALGPLVGGYVYDQTGTYTLAFVIMLLMFAVCAALLLLVREPARTEAVA
jgi:MFS family permease